MCCAMSMNHRHTAIDTVRDQETWYIVNVVLSGTIKSALTTTLKEKMRSSYVDIAVISTI